MISIQIDEQTAKALSVKAEALGVSLADYLRILVEVESANPRPEWDELEREFTNLSVDAGLASDFSRADIYADHD